MILHNCTSTVLVRVFQLCCSNLPNHNLLGVRNVTIAGSEQVEVLVSLLYAPRIPYLYFHLSLLHLQIRLARLHEHAEKNMV